MLKQLPVNIEAFLQVAPKDVGLFDAFPLKATTYILSQAFKRGKVGE